MNETAAGAMPQRTLLTARSEYLEGFKRLLGLARRELCIFDPDLSELGVNSPQCIAMLSRLLRENRNHRVCIALHDTGYVSTHCPRLIALLGSHTEGLLIHKTEGDAAKVQDCFVLADSEHLVRRPVSAQARGVLVLDDPAECQPMRERFDEIWELAIPAVSANTAGL